MKNYLLMGAFCLYGSLYAQYSDRMGINTQYPETDLHVNGTFKVEKLILAKDFETLGPVEDYTFLLKSADNSVISYNQFLDFGKGEGADFIAPLNLIQFKINTDNSDKDWIYEFDTNIDAKRFAVIISSFGYNLPVHSGERETPVQQIFPFIKNDKWYLKADYASFRPTGKDLGSGQWVLNLLVFDRSYANMIQPAAVDYSKMNNGELPQNTIEL